MSVCGEFVSVFHVHNSGILQYVIFPNYMVQLVFLMSIRSFMKAILVDTHYTVLLSSQNTEQDGVSSDRGFQCSMGRQI